MILIFLPLLYTSLQVEQNLHWGEIIYEYRELKNIGKCTLMPVPMLKHIYDLLFPVFRMVFEINVHLV